jgi:hypothetical protein
MMALCFVAEARVCERFGEKKRIAEFVAETLFERIHQGRPFALIIVLSAPARE